MEHIPRERRPATPDSTGPTLPASPHFDLHEMAAGVWTAIARRDGAGAALGNAGIGDLGDRALVFDTCWTLQAAGSEPAPFAAWAVPELFARNLEALHLHATAAGNAA